MKKAHRRGSSCQRLNSNGELSSCGLDETSAHPVELDPDPDPFQALGLPVLFRESVQPVGDVTVLVIRLIGELVPSGHSNPFASIRRL